MRFENREEAARLLAHRLARYRGRDPLVLAIPRGAVPMACIIAEELHGDLDVVLVRKIGAPGNPELAIGAVDERGTVTATHVAHDLGVGQQTLQARKAEGMRALAERRRLYTPVRPPLEPAGRVVIIVDDGVATGATMLAALNAIRQRSPARLVAAMAVAPPHTLQELEQVADEVVCLHPAPELMAVGQFFADFSQVSEEEVVALLERHQQLEAK